MYGTNPADVDTGWKANAKNQSAISAARPIDCGFPSVFYSNPEEVGTIQLIRPFSGEMAQRNLSRQRGSMKANNALSRDESNGIDSLDGTFPITHKEEMPHIRSDIVGKTLVKIERAVIESWRVEDVVRLSIPQNKQEITVQIDVIKVLPSGNQSISGHALDNHDHGFIMTVGKQSIFATIGTEDGVFNIRGNEGYAWVISSRELNHHLRPEILDYRVPKK